MSSQRQLHLYQFDADLKARLVLDADADDRDVSDVLEQILSARYGIPYTGTIRRGRGAGAESRALNFPVSERLYRRVDADVARQPKGRRSKVCVVEDIVRAHYDKLAA